MIRTIASYVFTVLGVAFLWTGIAYAEPPPETKCEAGKNEESERYAVCLLMVEAKLLKTRGLCSVFASPCYRDEECPTNETCEKDTTRYNRAVRKCEDRYSANWENLERRAAADSAACPDGLRQEDVKEVIDECVSNVAAGLAGNGLPAARSHPLRTGQTQCDQGTGALGTCPGSPAGQDGSVLKGATRSYTDNGNGTITDNMTELMWEKLSGDGSIHDQDTQYTWYTAFTTKVATLNSTNFAGYNDWRLPNRFELETLLDQGRVDPSINPAFNTGCVASCTVRTCSCTPRDQGYWSSTTYQPNTTWAWFVFFYAGHVSTEVKSLRGYVRAVRGGL